MVLIGSARIDSRGRVSGDAAGDQKQTASPDFKGEVSVENFYLHKLGWVVLRPKKNTHELAFAMLRACNNKCVGYNQYRRLDIMKDGTDSNVNTSCDCSSLVRKCVYEVYGTDPGNFDTGAEKRALLATGLFTEVPFTKASALREGDVLVTKTKGHTAIVVQADTQAATPSVSYYKKYTGATTSLVDALKGIKVDSSFTTRKRIAVANGISNYSGTATQNDKLLKLLKEGKLIKA